MCGDVGENCFFASSRLGPVSQRWYMLARASWEKAGHGNCEAHGEVLVFLTAGFACARLVTPMHLSLRGWVVVGEKRMPRDFRGMGGYCCCFSCLQNLRRASRWPEDPKCMLALDKCACYGTGLGVGFPGRIIMAELGEEHIQFLEM